MSGLAYFTSADELVAAIDERLAEHVGDSSPTALGMAAGLVEARFLARRLLTPDVAGLETALVEAIASEVRMAAGMDAARAEVDELRAEVSHLRRLMALRRGLVPEVTP
jgi:hypothetical protein